MQIMDTKHSMVARDGLFQRGHVDSLRGGFYEYIQGFGDDAPRTAEDESADDERDYRVSDRISGDGHKDPGGNHAKGGDGVAERVKTSTADVQVTL